MNICFITNIISIHQMELWDFFTFNRKIIFNYVYTTTDHNEKRYKADYRPYCLFSKEIKDINSYLNKQDIIIVSLGSIEDERINKLLIGKENLIIYSEHLSKHIDISSFYKKTKYLLFHFFKRPRYYKGISRNSIVLSSSSHAGYDFMIAGFKKNNIYRFGYFPKYVFNNIELINNHVIVFVGRNIPSKHPEDSIFAYNYLNKVDNKFSLNIIGQGFNSFDIKQDINVKILGELSRDEANQFLLKSELFIFSSTREEGWGVVLAEAMAAGCFVIANINAGSTKFLVKNGYNGLTYKNRNQLAKRLDKYFKMPLEKRNKIRNRAVETIKRLWSAEIAADRLYEFCCSWVEKKRFKVYKNGPLSKDKCKI